MLDSIFLYCAIGGGIVMLFQLAMILLGVEDGGFGDDMDVGGLDIGDADAGDTSGLWLLEMISLRTLAAAATFFGLVGKASLASGQPTGVSFALACAAGFAAMYAVYWAFKQIFKLETSGNTDIRQAVGLPARVYVPIGPASESAGKVQLELQGRTVEYQAVTDHPDRLPTGEQVFITEVLSGDTVKVSVESVS